MHENGFSITSIWYSHKKSLIDIIDRNQCPVGYKALQDSCYKFINRHKTFDDARKTCKRESADLMVVDSNIKQGISSTFVFNQSIVFVLENHELLQI